MRSRAAETQHFTGARPTTLRHYDGVHVAFNTAAWLATQVSGDLIDAELFTTPAGPTGLALPARIPDRQAREGRVGSLRGRTRTATALIVGFIDEHVGRQHAASPGVAARLADDPALSIVERFTAKLVAATLLTRNRQSPLVSSSGAVAIPRENPLDDVPFTGRLVDNVSELLSRRLVTIVKQAGVAPVE